MPKADNYRQTVTLFPCPYYSATRPDMNKPFQAPAQQPAVTA
jgi:hypothetical protein